MSYNVIFHPDAKKELDALDGSIRLIVLKLIKKIGDNPYLGTELGNVAGMDLTGYRKIYADRKRIRLVYTIIEKKVMVYIIAIGERDKNKVYKVANRRKLD